MTTVKPFVAALRRELREARPRPTRTAFWAALCSLLLYAVWRHVAYMSMVDMLVYRAEGAAVLHGHDLYGIRVSTWSLPATYPPFAAMLFTPTALVAVPVLRILVTGGNVLLLAALAYLSCRLVRWPSPGLRPAVVLLAAGFGVWLEPVFNTLRYGQINLLLAVLVLVDLQRPDGARGKGILVGLAAGIKITPAFFAVYLLLSGRPRAALNAALSCAATVALGALVLPRASWSFWTADLWDTSRVGKEYIVDNQSLRGALDRLQHTPHAGVSVLVVSALILVLGLVVAVRLDRRAKTLPRAEAWAFVCVAVTCLLVSPISWTHHWVWCVPMLVLLAAEAGHERARGDGRVRWRALAVTVAVACCSFAMWLVPHQGETDLTVPLLLQPFASLYPLLGICFLLLAATRLRRRRPVLTARQPNRSASAASTSIDASS